ncbi:MAG: DUF4886 domain-containing protein, partial [Candidatus Cryptobacteroides sp.]|nr:DUF4886 domain-containing protein [Candidatus Cryptobacteroides sp.]
ADGVVMIIGNMYIPGCSLERHLDNSRTGSTDYSYRKIGADGVRRVTPGYCLEEALADEKWDYVTMQQSSPISGIFSTWEASLPQLYDYLRARVDAHFAIHQTWAYEQTSTHKGFVNYDNDQMKMYNAIVDAVNKAADLIGVDIIIPVGTAVQNARTSFIGDHLTRDGYHLSPTIGRFIASCTWYCRLTGRKLRRNSFRPEGIEPEMVNVAHRAAEAAVRRPGKVKSMN